MDHGSSGNQIQGGKKILLLYGSVTWGACTAWNNPAAGRSQGTVGGQSRGMLSIFTEFASVAPGVEIPFCQSKENNYSVKEGLSSLPDLSYNPSMTGEQTRRIEFDYFLYFGPSSGQK